MSLYFSSSLSSPLKCLSDNPLQCHFEIWSATMQPLQGKLSLGKVKKQLPRSPLFEFWLFQVENFTPTLQWLRHLLPRWPHELQQVRLENSKKSSKEMLAPILWIVRFDPHRRKPCPWWHSISNSSFDDLNFLERVKFLSFYLQILTFLFCIKLSGVQQHSAMGWSQRLCSSEQLSLKVICVTLNLSLKAVSTLYTQIICPYRLRCILDSEISRVIRYLIFFSC